MTIKPSPITGSSPSTISFGIPSPNHISLNGNINNTIRSPSAIMTSSAASDDSVEMLFTPGSLVKVTTGLHQVLEGEVLFFNYERKTIVIKIPVANKAGISDVHMINLDAASNVEMVKEVKHNNNSVNNSANAQDINIKKVHERLQRQTMERKSLAAAFAEGVTEDGLRLYLNLQKTIGKDSLVWKGKEIIVNHVVIRPPYKAVNGSLDCVMKESDRVTEKAEDYVKQLVNKFWEIQSKISPSKDVVSKATDGSKTNDGQPKTGGDASKDAASPQSAKDVVIGGGKNLPDKKNGSIASPSPTPSDASSGVGGGQRRNQQSKNAGGNRGGSKKGGHVRNGPN